MFDIAFFYYTLCNNVEAKSCFLGENPDILDNKQWPDYNYRGFIEEK